MIFTYFYDFPETAGNFIIPTDEVIFFSGVGLNHQPVERRLRWISRGPGTLLALMKGVAIASIPSLLRWFLWSGMPSQNDHSDIFSLGGSQPGIAGHWTQGPDGGERPRALDRWGCPNRCHQTWKSLWKSLGNRL